MSRSFWRSGPKLYPSRPVPVKVDLGSVYVYGISFITALAPVSCPAQVLTIPPAPGERAASREAARTIAIRVRGGRKQGCQELSGTPHWVNGVGVFKSLRE